MRLATLTAACVVVATAGAAWADQAGAVYPNPPAATTATSSVPAVEDGRVLVLPFEQLGGLVGTYDWVGRAVQQNLVTELGRVKVLSVATPAYGKPQVTDVKGATEAGRQAGAEFVVYGSYQINGQDLRINGEVVHVEDGRVTGTLKSTGTVRDLFSMEDTVATQAKRLVAPEPVKPVDAQPSASTPQGAQPVQPQPQVVPPAVTNSYNTNYNTYTYYPQNAGYYGAGYYYPSYGYYGYGYRTRYYGGCYYPVVLNTAWSGVTRTYHQPVGVGTSQSMVATGMISVGGNFLPNGQLAR